MTHENAIYTDNIAAIANTPLTMSDAMHKKFNHLWSLVGNTPLLELHYTFRGNQRKIYVKCEQYNLTGSIKDRLALYLLQKAYEMGTIKPGNTIVEASSCNTGIAFAAIGKALGHPVKIIMPDWYSKDRADTFRSMGADVSLVSKAMGGLLECIMQSERKASEDPNIFLPRQFENYFNVEVHEKTTAREIWMQLQSIDLTPDAFVAGVGTGGTITGVGNYLKKRNPAVCIHPIEPEESPVLSSCHKICSHRIHGISDEFIPPIIDLNRLDEVLQVSDGDAILMAQKAAQQLGLGVGISSGANLIGAILLQEQFGGNAVVVTILPDSNKRYTGTALFNEEPMKPEYISGEVEFLEYVPVRRSDSLIIH